MKTIITAAGFGSRLGGLTGARPKCMLEVCGNTILGHQLQAFADAGLHDVLIVRGHGAEYVDAAGAAFVENPDYATTNMVYSMMRAAEHLADGFVCSYSDILFESDTVRALLAARDDICIAVDPDWREAYDGRDQHPPIEAEKVVIDDCSCVRRCGKIIDRPQQAHAEFIGLIKCSARGADYVRRMYAKARLEYAGRPFMNAPTFEQVILSDFLQYLTQHRLRVHCVPIAGPWREIDTPQDLENARRSWRAPEPVHE